MLAHQQAPYLNNGDINHKSIIPMDDACWQTQKRVPVEFTPPQVGKIAIPELTEKEVQRTIVAQPASYQKVKWNEFPEEPQVELITAPKTKTQEWVPVNQEQNELQRSFYKPARIAAVWPPPQDEIVKEGATPLVVKASDDTAWINQDQSGVMKQAIWGKTSRINRVWPPPEHELTQADISGPEHMPVVQWPPPEAEAHEREQVEILQKHIPTKKIERQWPPPPPQYRVVESSGEIETRYNPAEIEQQQQQQQDQHNGHAVNSLRMGHIQA
ncbi:unnamed protein product [Caenorhabditis bovis]|uniref:Uncharacterized protein n=1 Tax=Caenorhabditis bovis TaxID=2654633 RepID=A0A8S1E0H7_9PELO|nr:unnamed protein product [Caenorhabditis bovis]